MSAEDAGLGLHPAEAALLARLPAARHAEHGVPAAGDHGRRARLHAAVDTVLGDIGTRRESPLGPGWSGDADVTGDLPSLRRAATAAGWIPLDGWLAGIGSPARDVWAVLDGGAVLGAVDLLAPRSGGPAAARRPGARVARRARRRGEVRVREVLELLRLADDRADDGPDDRAGARPAPTGDPAVDDAVAALLADPDQPPVPVLPGWRRAARAARRRAASRRLVIALCGVDGAGKSSTAAALADALTACGLPVGRVWARPGMNLRRLGRLAGALKAATGQRPEPGVRRVAAGDAAVASRRGLVGWLWSLLVVGAFAVDVRRQHARARGVVLYDRHVVDALATIDVLYGGGDRRLQRALAARALPRAARTAYLAVDAATAAARKPDDTIGLAAVTAQLERYEAHLARLPDVVRVDATQPVPATVAAILRSVPPPA